MSILVIDVGTSSVRAAIVRPDATVGNVHRLPTPPEIPFAGLVEFDPVRLADAALQVAQAAISEAGPVNAVGITTQRASAIAWDVRSGQPLGPGLGWQDLRTVGTCLEMQAEGLRFSPSESATKFSWLLDLALQTDPGVGDHVRYGTVDSWIAWKLTGGRKHITDPSNAGVTGLYSIAANTWDIDAATKLGLDPASLPLIGDTSGLLADETILAGNPPLCALIGDQQASMMGQGCTREGLAKITFGTGAMLDVCRGTTLPPHQQRSSAGCFPIAAWQIDGQITWGTEAIMLAAGTTVDWLVEDMGLLCSAAESEEVAARCSDTDGVVAVPALLGYGTPQWDFGARGAIFGITRGTRREHIVRAVLEGIAHSGADLLEAAQSDTGLDIESLRVDGGMSANSVFVQALADACDRPIEISPELEATTLGAGYLAGLAIRTWAHTDEVAAAWTPREVVYPSGAPAHRDRWAEATRRAGNWYPDLSAITF